MGDRANIAVLQGSPDRAVFIYSHWSGLEGMFEKLQTALRRKQRWDDNSYLCRIIISEVIRDSLDRETGYGVSTYMVDNEHPILVVDTSGRRVGIASENDPLRPVKWWSMEEFCEMKWDGSLEDFR